MKTNDVDSATASKHKVEKNENIVGLAWYGLFWFGLVWFVFLRYFVLFCLAAFHSLLFVLDALTSLFFGSFLINSLLDCLSQLEERQRAEARERKANGEKWKTKVTKRLDCHCKLFIKPQHLILTFQMPSMFMFIFLFFPLLLNSFSVKSMGFGRMTNHWKNVYT